MKLKELFSGNATQESAKNPEAEMRAKAEGIIVALYDLCERGEAENDIEEYIEDEKFSDLLSEFDIKAAVRIYDAEKRAASVEKEGMRYAQEMLDKRKSMPKAMRAEMPTEPETDFSKMSLEDFQRIKKRLATSKMR